jgi:hypothetical protein
MKEAAKRRGPSIEYPAELPKQFPLVVNVLLDDPSNLCRTRGLVAPLRSSVGSFRYNVSSVADSGTQATLAPNAKPALRRWMPDAKQNAPLIRPEVIEAWL